MTRWVEVWLRTRRSAVEEGDNDEGRKSRKTVQIFVKMGPMHFRVVEQFSEEVTNWGVAESVTDARCMSRAGCGEEEDTRTRRAKRRRNTWRARREMSRRVRRAARVQCFQTDNDTVDPMIEENEGYQELVEQLSKGGDVEVELEIQ